MADDFAFKPVLGPAFRNRDDPGVYHSIRDNTGRKIGHVHIDVSDPKHVEIDHVAVNDKANSLGPRHVRELHRQLKTHYPNAETVGGNRVSGARALHTPMGDNFDIKDAIRRMRVDKKL